MFVTLYKTQGSRSSPSKRVQVTLSLYTYFLFIYLFLTLQHCIGFAIHQHASATGVHMFLILNPPSHLPPDTIPLSHPSAPDFIYFKVKEKTLMTTMFFKNLDDALILKEKKGRKKIINRLG